MMNYIYIIKKYFVYILVRDSFLSKKACNILLILASIAGLLIIDFSLMIVYYSVLETKINTNFILLFIILFSLILSSEAFYVLLSKNDKLRIIDYVKYGLLNKQENNEYLVSMVTGSTLLSYFVLFSLNIMYLYIQYQINEFNLQLLFLIAINLILSILNLTINVQSKYNSYFASNNNSNFFLFPLIIYTLFFKDYSLKIGSLFFTNFMVLSPNTFLYISILFFILKIVSTFMNKWRFYSYKNRKRWIHFNNPIVRDFFYCEVRNKIITFLTILLVLYYILGDSALLYILTAELGLLFFSPFNNRYLINERIINYIGLITWMNYPSLVFEIFKNTFVIQFFYLLSTFILIGPQSFLLFWIISIVTHILTFMILVGTYLGVPKFGLPINNTLKLLEFLNVLPFTLSLMVVIFIKENNVWL